jgi:ATP-dependent exoDNAse (exonuclease V) beta subunit
MGGWEEREELAEGIAAGLPHAQLWRQAEARMLAQRVAELVEAGDARAGDVVVLLRAAGDLEVFERALQLRGLRTLAAVGTFWGHQQIGDLISYLRALANPLDEQALYGALASPLGGCSLDCLALLADAAHLARRGAWATALEAVSSEGSRLGPPELRSLAVEDRRALKAFCELLASERANVSTRTISELIERAIDATGYRRHVLGLDWGERRLANLHKLLRLARRFEASEGRDLRAFLDHVQYLEGAVKAEPDAPVEGVEPDAVRLMTVHAAKGLEFPVVCLADLGRQPKTQTPDLLLDGDRIGIRLVRLDGAGSTPALEYEPLCQERRQREAQEEDRILYVAMTRARERLLLSGTVDFERWPSSQQAPTPISWLGPALSEDLPALVRDGRAPLHDLTLAGERSAAVRCRLNSPANAGAVLRLSSLSAAPGAGSGSQRPEPASGAATVEPSAGPAGELASLTVPAEQDRISSLSYTSLSELERCGYRYYLERVLGLAEERAATGALPRDGGLDPRQRGILVHSLMESLDFERPMAPAPAEVGESARALGMHASAGECAEIAALIEQASRAAPALRVAEAVTVRREHPFAFSLGPQEPLVTGVIDLLAGESDGGQLVVDYKSDRVGADVDLGELVELQYGIQRLLYALAALRDGAPSVEILHWFLERPAEWVGARYTAAERLELEQQLAAKVARARELAFSVSPRPHRGLCLTCPGRGGLCSWGDAETLREDPEEPGGAAGRP